MKQLIEDFKASVHLAVISLCLVAVSVVAYKVGVHNGREQMARYISNIRQIDRINALAPKVDR